MSPLAARIHSALPQTQCTRCGYPDCASYAQAVADGDAQINQCPPGGAEGISRLSAITGHPALPLNPENGTQGPRTVAVIDEAWCIGCTLCMPVCPTDAIVGTNKLMHTVIESCCTGCELCVAACPVDCISLVNVTGERTGWLAWSQEQAVQALQRYEFHCSKAHRQAESNSFRLEQMAPSRRSNPPAHTHGAEGDEADRKRAVIEAALARSRASRKN